MQTNDIIYDIIAKALRQEASAAEIEQLDHWIASAGDNRKEYEELSKIWALSQQALQPQVFDTDAAWQKVDALMHTRSLPEQGKRPVVYLRRIMAAAAVIILLAGIWLLWSRNSTKWQTFTAVADNQYLTFPDGSNALLRKGSSISYPAVFDKNERTVKLSGEAFFEVQGSKGSPFTIATRYSDIKVLGTSFLVRGLGTGDEVVVVSGKIAIAQNNSPGNKLEISAGQKVILKDAHFEQAPVNDLNYLAWKTGLLSFEDAPLSKVLGDISHYYNYPVSIRQGQETIAEKIHITVRFEKQSFTQVIEEIKLTTGLETNKEADQLVFFKK